MEMKFDNDLAQIIDSEAARKMESKGYDIKFIGLLDPAFRSRKTGVWSKVCIPGGTILAFDYNTLIERVGIYKK
jgi:hypothetical protein